MRKSLGDKRKELTSEAIAEITMIYSNAISGLTNKGVKVLKNEELGYARLTVERPLRRVWQVNEETLLSAPPGLRSRLEKLVGETFFDAAEAVERILETGFDAKESKMVLKILATTDPTASPLRGKKQVFEPDTELRDHENIAIPPGFIRMNESERAMIIEAIADEHLLNEIAPYVNDAWIDHTKTKIGYEIPFIRQFYTYTPPRPAADIKREVETLELQIQELMRNFK
jgi:type I restriction enzyme M protein